ncbi:unnamed protein product [Phytophthora fragariaefolia]|uniref:Unnamed protein product n=1 Tax=Phytophthora fragariaefolia TaxID=1490495 RepID=A0A9W7CJ49_9STRA|nr:unnamed protein product [Phytophthora fragariaefolia]
MCAPSGRRRPRGRHGVERSQTLRSARPANAKSAERKGRDASSQNNKSKRTPKYRGSTDNSDSDSRSGSSDQDSDHSDSSSFEDVVPNVPTVTGPGGTMFTFRPYVNASALEDFDEKAPLAVWTRWLERFQSIAVQGDWREKVKIYEMKLKLSAAVRNWRANLRSKVRREWKKFLKEFCEMYCEEKISDSERYYTMLQRKSESPLEFYYRLNKVVDKAGIDFDSSSKQRERHLKVFTKKLLDSRLRTTLQAKASGSYEIWTDNDWHGRFQPKRSGRAYVIQDEDSLDEDEDDREVRFHDVVEEVPNVPSAVSPAAGSAQPGSYSGKDGSQTQDISSAVFRIIENSGWRPPPNGEFRPAPRSPRFEDRNRTKFCERCSDFGHSTESCWSDLKCDRCGRKGHPAQLCRVRPCSFCKKFHEDQCGEWKKSQAVKTLARQERVGLKTTPELCVLVYVGPELRSKSQDNHQCMTVISENGEYFSDLPLPDQLRLAEDCPDNNDWDDQPEFRLGPGQRHGWWEEHNSDETKKVAMVHGAVNNCRTDILLDSGASVSMMSLDLARRPKLRLKFCKQLRVSGLGGAPTIITATTEVKISLGPRVVYIMELWVANIGDGVDVLLGMNFMYSAGVRQCAREGLVKLPDEETVLLVGGTPDHKGRGLDLAVTPKTCLYFGAGESAVVRIDYGQRNPQREVVWAGRGDRWVTQIIYAAKSWLVAVKVVNISDKTVWIDSRTAVARIGEFGFFPTTGRFGRPGLRRYKECQALIYENTNSREVRKREERLAQLRQESESPCARTPEYQWPKKLVVRSPAGSAQVHMVRLQPRPNVGKEKSPAKTHIHLSETEISGTSDSEGTKSREAKLVEKTGGSHEDSGHSGEILKDRSPVVVLDEDSDSDERRSMMRSALTVMMGTKMLRKLSKRNHQLGRVQTGSHFRSEGSRKSMNGACR